MANEIDKLDPLPDFVFLRSGMRVQLESLKARQFFKLLRIITHGALPGMKEAGLFEMTDLTGDEFLGRLLSVTLLAVPDAEDETMEFLRSLVYPAGLVDRKPLNKQDVEHNKMLWEVLDAELANPELDDIITIIEAVVKRESEDIQALGKRLASMFKLAVKTNQIDPTPSPTASTPASSAASPEPSTSSPRNTTGTTTASATSPSVDSGNVSPQFESASTMPAWSVSNG